MRLFSRICIIASWCKILIIRGVYTLFSSPMLGWCLQQKNQDFAPFFHSFISFFVKRSLPRSKGCEVGICSQKRAKSFKGSTIMDWVMVRRFTSLAFGSSRSTYYLFQSFSLLYLWNSRFLISLSSSSFSIFFFQVD